MMERDKEHCKMGEETAEVDEISLVSHIQPQIRHDFPIRLYFVEEYKRNSR